MTYSEFRDFAEALSALATVAAVVLGGIWALRRFILQREHVPHIQFTVGVNFVGIRGDVWLCAVTAAIRNEGLVRHVIRKFTFSLRTLDQADPIVTDGAISGQVLFPNKLLTGSWLPRDRDYTFIEPKVESRYSYVTTVPRTAEFVLVHGRFTFGDSAAFQTADNVLRVPVFESEM